MTLLRGTLYIASSLVKMWHFVRIIEIHRDLCVLNLTRFQNRFYVLSRLCVTADYSIGNCFWIYTHTELSAVLLHRLIYRPRFNVGKRKWDINIHTPKIWYNQLFRNKFNIISYCKNIATSISISSHLLKCVNLFFYNIINNSANDENTMPQNGTRERGLKYNSNRVVSRASLSL